jgi:phosphodiesterase/alkaline phosphatase D-like protein
MVDGYRHWRCRSMRPIDCPPLQGRNIAPALVLSVSLSLAIPTVAGAARFTYGVTAGEVRAKSAVIWAHATKAGKYSAEIATDKRFNHVENTAKVTARKSRDFTIQTKMTGLRSGRQHYYRFCKGKKCSETGTFETAPPPKHSKTIKFAYSGDDDAARSNGQAKPFWGHMRAFKSMLAEDNDFNIHLGDTIYSDSEVPHPGPVALTRAEKWAKYKLNLGERNLTTLRKSAGFYSQWDDHEFVDDFSPNQNSFTPSGVIQPITLNGKKIYKAGQQAFRDYAPVTYSHKDGLYRTFRWGKNLELFFLDERSFRSAEAWVGGTCDNPMTGMPDFAPTLPTSTRAAFSALLPSLAEPVSQQCKNAINDPHRTMLGKRQYHRFIHDVASSKARWKLVVNEVPIQQMFGSGAPYDNWEGYAFERVKLLEALMARGVDHLAFLTTDSHGAFENVVRLRTFADDVAPSNAPANPQNTPYHDHVIGPVATKTFWQELDDAPGTPAGTGKLDSTLFFTPAPPAGVGMSCDQGDKFSYAEVKVTKQSVTIRYRNQKGGPVFNTSGQRCGPYVITG